MNVFHRITDWYFTKKALPYWCVLFIDCCIVLFCGILDGYLKNGGNWAAGHFWQMVAGMCLCLPIYIIVFRLFHTYSCLIRFSSYADLGRITTAMLLGSIASGLLGSIVTWKAVEIPSLISFFSIFVLGTFLMWAVRLAIKSTYETVSGHEAVPVVIYGTRSGGVALAGTLASMQTKAGKKFSLKAFISDDPDINDVFLAGKKVIMNNDLLLPKLRKIGIRVFLVSPLKSDDFRNNQKLVDGLIEAGITIMMLPVAQVWDGKSPLSSSQLHEVEIEDLLPRDEIKVDMENIGRMLTGRRILITGAAGSIGSEMVRQIAKFGPSDLILVDQAETPMHDMRLWMNRFISKYDDPSHIHCETVVASITDRDHMELLFSKYRPEYVFHAAAYKHVPMMEDNPIQAVRNNIAGTRIIADLAVKYATRKFVMISTDKAVNPANVMGCSKRICEIYCQSLNQAIVEGKVKGITQFVTTRFGNVLGSNGSVIPLFREQIAAGGPVTVTHPDIIRYFMLIPEACKLVLEAGTMGKGGEIFVFDMGKPVRILDLAKRMINLSGAQNIEIVFTGLRDGEKLYEEVLTDTETTIPTVHPKIMTAKVREYDYETALRNEDELMALARTHDDILIVRKMKEIVPEFKSKVGRFQQLDSAEQAEQGTGSVQA